MKGTLTSPARRTLAFDGQRFFQRDDDTGILQSTPLEGRDPAQVNQELFAVFGSFVVEGWRAPLLSSTTTARRLPHPRGPEAVELVAATSAPEGTVRVIYTLRWPSMDFLEKRVEGSGTSGGVRVDAERCEPKLSLCVPTRWTHLEGGAPVASVTLTTVRLGAEVLPEEFTLAPPADGAAGAGAP